MEEISKVPRLDDPVAIRLAVEEVLGECDGALTAMQPLRAKLGRPDVFVDLIGMPSDAAPTPDDYARKFRLKSGEEIYIKVGGEYLKY